MNPQEGKKKTLQENSNRRRDYRDTPFFDEKTQYLNVNSPQVYFNVKNNSNWYNLTFWNLIALLYLHILIKYIYIYLVLYKWDGITEYNTYTSLK